MIDKTIAAPISKAPIIQRTIVLFENILSTPFLINAFECKPNLFYFRLNIYGLQNEHIYYTRFIEHCQVKEHKLS